MEWLSNVFAYSALERSVLAEDAEPSIFKRYSRMIDAADQRVHCVLAPPSNAAKLPALPIVVFIHGLGGNIMNFAYLAPTVNQYGEVLLIDLPGHGKSRPDGPASRYGPEAFTHAGIVAVLSAVVRQMCGERDFVLVGHSYGTTHALRLALGPLGSQCRGVVCVAPPYGSTIPVLEQRVAGVLPSLVFDTVFRARDRQGGLHSPSVNRMVSQTASDDARRDQLRINLMASSATVLSTVAGSRFFSSDEGTAFAMPVLVIAACDDHVCPPERAERLAAAIDSAKLVKISNVGHAVMFEQPEIVAGLVAAFLKDRVDERLSLAWQLQYLASLTDKWSLKNEAKWAATSPVGHKVGLFEGMKVPREGDDVHGTRSLEAGHPEIVAVIDISREKPPYEPGNFERIHYYKFPTVSKIPPSESDVKRWIKLVNQITHEPWFHLETDVIGVHCHYGFNRTGFFIVSYLIEEEGYTVADALEAYRVSRPPGIRHQHFIDELYLRYNL